MVSDIPKHKRDPTMALLAILQTRCPSHASLPQPAIVDNETHYQRLRLGNPQILNIRIHLLNTDSFQEELRNRFLMLLVIL